MEALRAESIAPTALDAAFAEVGAPERDYCKVNVGPGPPLHIVLFDLVDEPARFLRLCDEEVVHQELITAVEVYNCKKGHEDRTNRLEQATHI